jgi:hypothetical protein
VRANTYSMRSMAKMRDIQKNYSSEMIY